MEPLLSIQKLSVTFDTDEGVLKAVDDVSLDILRGEVLGLVGESGCGKTTTGRCVLRLVEPTAGEILYRGRAVTGVRGPGLKPFRREMQIVFQDPFSSLNPRMTVEQIVAEYLPHL